VRARRCRASKARRNTGRRKEDREAPDPLFIARLERQRTCPEPDPVAEPEPLIEPDPEPLPDPAPLSEPLPLAAPLSEQAAKANDSAIAAILSRAFLFMTYLLAWIRWAPSESNTSQFGLSRV
jgi:hypothetical protein